MRKPYIDNIRSCTVFLVVVYHILYMFNGVQTAGVIGPIAHAPLLDSVQYLLYPWFMLILFLISGMCSRFYLETHTPQQFFRARTQRLLIPSTVGVLVFGWAQGYFNVLLSHAWEQTALLPALVRYLILCISGTGVLWTMQVLWVLSVVLLAVRKLDRDRLLAHTAGIGLPALLLAGIAVWASAQVLNTPIIPVYRFGIYGAGYLLGYFVFSQEAVIRRLENAAVPLLAAALPLGVVYTVRTFGQNYAEPPAVSSPLAIGYAWVMCLAMLGGFRRWGNVTNRLTDFAAAHSFGLYIFHYLPLSAAAWYLTQYTRLAPVWVYLLTTLAAFGGGLALFRAAARIPGLRWCLLGMRNRKTKESVHHV